MNSLQDLFDVFVVGRDAMDSLQKLLGIFPEAMLLVLHPQHVHGLCLLLVSQVLQPESLALGITPLGYQDLLAVTFCCCNGLVPIPKNIPLGKSMKEGLKIMAEKVEEYAIKNIDAITARVADCLPKY